ncbi:MAG TPA: PQQ-binding-like beta-propeller repeat protein [Candidatus Xenobia bacterium]|jgi:outer membrane protein assembly factor BamB
MTTISASTSLPHPQWAVSTADEYTQILQQPKDGLAIVATGSEQGLLNLRGVDAATGQVKWAVDNAFYANKPPTVGPDGDLYGQNLQGNGIEVRDGKTGQVIRSMPEPDIAMYTGVTSGKNLYVGAANPTEVGVWALDPSSGQEKWHKALHYMSGITPTEVGGSVMCENGSDLWALDPDTGTLKWSFQAEHGVNQPPVLGPDGTLYVIDHNSTVYALDSKNAQGEVKPKWTNHLDMPVKNPDQVNNLDVSQPLVFTPQGLVVAATGQSVRLLDAATGQQKWEDQLPIDSPAVAGANGQVYVGNGEGISQFNPADGSTAYWQATFEAPPAGQAPANIIAPFGVGKLAGFQ